MGDSTSTYPLFLHARFEVPDKDASGESKTDTVVTKQHFDSANHQPAQIGIEGEPVKVRRLICLTLFA